MTQEKIENSKVPEYNFNEIYEKTRNLVNSKQSTAIENTENFINDYNSIEKFTNNEDFLVNGKMKLWKML